MTKYIVNHEDDQWEIEAADLSDAREIVLDEEGFHISEAKNQFVSSLYYQRSNRYKGKFLGNTNVDMQTYGCALMCWSYAIGGDPLEVNQSFATHGVYNANGEIAFAKACEVLGLKNYERSYDIGRMPTQEITIKEVKLGKGKHFVIRLNKDGKRSIYDPWTNSIKPINFYKFVSYRIFDK